MQSAKASQAEYEKTLREQELEKRRKSKQRHSLQFSLQKESLRFAEQDKDNNLALDFEEFLAMMPAKMREMHTPEQLRIFFNAADLDGDGTVSMSEFFRWSLTKSELLIGQESLLTAFEFYDKNKTGTLDAREFEPLAREMGFGPVADQVFMGLDANNSGRISYRELIASLKTSMPKNKEATQLMLSLIHTYDHEAKDEAARALDTSGWVIKGTDFQTVRNELQNMLAKQDAHVVDLIKIFDVDADSNLEIDDMEFMAAMRNKLGYRGPAHVLAHVFASLDLDHSGKIGFDELFEFVRGKRHSLDKRVARVRAMQMEPPPGINSLSHIVWNVPTLRYLMQQMLTNSNVTMAELMRAWDISRDGTLTLREFLSSLQAFFKKGDARVWTLEVEAVALEAFCEIDNKRQIGTQGAIDIEELAAWLEIPTDATVVKKKSRRLLRIDRVELPEVPQPTTGRRLRMPSESPVVAESIEAFLERVEKARQRIQQRMLPRETAVNGLPSLQRWEVPKPLELPPLATCRVVYGPPTTEVSPRFAPPELPKRVPVRPTTHQLSVTRSPRKGGSPRKSPRKSRRHDPSNGSDAGFGPQGFQPVLPVRTVYI